MNTITPHRRQRKAVYYTYAFNVVPTSEGSSQSIWQMEAFR